MKTTGKYIFWICLILALLLAPLQGTGYLFYMVSVYFVLWVPMVVSLIVGWPAIYASLSFNFDFKEVWKSVVFGSALLVCQILIWIFFSTFQSMELAKMTDYAVQGADTLPASYEIRDQPFTVAKSLMKNQISDSQVGPNELDYMISNDQWVSSLDPVDFATKFLGTKTQGYVSVGNQGIQKVAVVRPYGKGSYFFTGDQWFIRTHGGYWNEWTDILSVRSGEEEFAVVSLIDRNGIWAYPSVEKVLIIHQDGQVEPLTIDDANADPRLKNVQLMPASHVEKIVEAYSCKNGFVSCIARKHKIKLQESATNDENKAPFHQNTQVGSFWVAPFGPYSKPALTGTALVQSDRISNTVYIFPNEYNEVYPGVDSLAAFIENDIAFEGFVWYREATVTSGDATSTSGCGNKTILELVPTFRMDPDGVVRQYYLGYVSSAPVSNQVLWYVIVDPTINSDGKITVFQPLKSAAEVELWQQGGLELSVSSEPVSNTVNRDSSQTGSDNYCPIEQMDEGTIVDLLRRIAEELDK